MIIKTKQDWFLTDLQLPKSGTDVLAYDGNNFEVYHFIDCFPPDFNMWAYLPKFDLLEIGLGLKKIDVSTDDEVGFVTAKIK